MNLSKACRFDPVLAYASGSADRTSDIVDTKGYQGACFIVHFAAIATGAVTSVVLKGSSDSGMSGAVSLAGLSHTIADDDDNQVFVLDVVNSKYRYVQLTVDKDAANATAESAVCLLYDGSVLPTTHPSDATIAFAHAPVSA